MDAFKKTVDGVVVWTCSHCEMEYDNPEEAEGCCEPYDEDEEEEIEE